MAFGLSLWKELYSLRAFRQHRSVSTTNLRNCRSQLSASLPLSVAKPERPKLKVLPGATSLEFSGLVSTKRDIRPGCYQPSSEVLKEASQVRVVIWNLCFSKSLCVSILCVQLSNLTLGYIKQRQAMMASTSHLNARIYLLIKRQLIPTASKARPVNFPTLSIKAIYGLHEDVRNLLPGPCCVVSLCRGSYLLR